MAIVFISPRKPQIILISAAVGVVSLGLIITLLIVFLSKPEPIAPEEVFKPKEVKIDFTILRSPQLEKLELFPDKVKKEFVYEAKTEEGEKKTGKILAFSEQEGRGVLSEAGLSDIEIERIKIGRRNPFTPFQVTEAEED